MIQVKKLYCCQKGIMIKKDFPKRDSLDVSFSLNKRDMLEAMKNLTSTAFSVYMYCVSNQNDYVFGLSSVDVCEQTGISSRSYTTAIQLLIQKGYIVYTNEKVTDGTETAPLYLFYSRPHAKIA